MPFVLRWAAAMLALTCASAAQADSTAVAGGEAFHRLGADPLQLRFEGETSARTWPVYVTRAEASSRARIHLGFTNAISVMPETSTLSIMINDVAVAQTPIAAATDPGALDVELPRGLLMPGFNNVRIGVSQRHRVDCSMEATYELWTQVDVATSGLAFPGVAEPRIDALDDLAALSPDASGAVTVNLVLPPDADAAALDNALRAVEAVAIRAGAQRPRVEMVEDVGERRGLFVLAGERSFLSSHGYGRFLNNDAGRAVGIEGQEIPGRVVVVAAGDGQKETLKAIESILPVRRSQDRAETPAAVRALVNQFGYPVREALHVPLRDLGVRTEEFNGRLYRASFDITLPGDFYPADYDKLTLSLTAGYAEGLLPTAQILVRVNDREAGSMPMKNPRGDLFRDRPVSVSLNALRPGVNHVVVEAQAADAGDRTCDVKHLMDGRKRFVLFDSSELIVPDFAHIGRLPNLAATLSSGFPYGAEQGESYVYIGGRDRRTLGAAATYLARTALVSGHLVGSRATFDQETAKRGSALFFAPLADLPPGVAETFGVDVPELKKLWSRSNASDAPAPEPGGVAIPYEPDSSQVYDQWADGGRAAPESFSPRVTLRALYDRYINIHRGDFALFRERDHQIEAPQRSTLLLAQTHGPKVFDTWTLVVGADENVMARDMVSLVAPSNWNEVEGRAAAFTPRGGAKSIDRASHTYFVPTGDYTPGNLRLVAAGFMSANLDDYVLCFVAMALALGVATRAAVRVHGNRS